MQQTLKFHDVKVATILGITMEDSKMFHMVLHKCQNVKVTGIHIRAPEHSRNTDGIHVGQSRDVDILDSIISTGDDCVSLGDGSTNIKIMGVACGPGHGISIGSLGNYENEEDVRGIKVKNCHFYNTDNGLRIKTWAPSHSSSVVSDVTYQDINMHNVKNPIIIDQYYCPDGRCSRNGESSVKIQGVKYINVQGSSATQKGVDIRCSKTHPCEDIVFTKLNLSLNGRQPALASCSNVDARFQGSNPSRCG